MESSPEPRDSVRLSRAGVGELVDYAAAGTAVGVPLDEVFLAVAEDTDNRRLRQVSLRLAEELARGADLSTALNSISGALPQYLQHALAASVGTGQTAAVLQALARRETVRKRLRRQLWSALLYPALVVALLLAVMAGLGLYVLPEFEAIYADFDLQIPASTILLLGAVDVIPWIAAALIAVPLAYLGLWLMPAGRRLVHWLRTGLPMFGRVWIWSGQHEFASMLEALLSQQVSLEDALDCTAASLKDRNLARATRIAAGKCQEGASLSRSLAESMHFDPALPALAGWGEAHDRLPEALRQAALIFEEEIDLYANFLRRTLPPILFVGVMATIFAFVTTVVEPLMSLINNLSWAPAPTATGFFADSAVKYLLQPSATLLLLGLCLWVSLRLLYGARGPAPDDAVYLFIRILSRSLVLVSIAVLFVFSANVLSLILAVVVGEAGLELILARRATQRQAAWRALAPALSSRQATIESLRFHQSRFTGLVARWYRRLVDDLERGVAWPEAVWKNRRALPREAPAYLGMFQGSTAPVELLELQQYEDVASRQVWHDTIERFAYLSTILFALAAVLVFSLMKIVPSYQSIMADFDMQLPAITIFVINLADLLNYSIFIPIAYAALAVLAAAIFVGVAYLCDWPVLQPLLDWIGFARHRAYVLRLLAVGVARGTPLTEALSRLESGWSAYPSGLVRRRIRAAHERIAAGGEWQAALQRSRLISATDAATLRAAQATDHLPWTMRMLADRTLRRFAFRWAVVQHVAFTATILVLGALVFLFAAAMFIPLTSMIESLSV